MSSTASQLFASRIEQVRLPDRSDDRGMPLPELDEHLARFAAAHRIEHDLTAASTAAFPPPDYFLAGVEDAVRRGRPGYTPLRGDLGVRNALAERLREPLGGPIDASAEMLLTTGTQLGLFSALSALVDNGDEVMLADPEYLCDEPLLRFLGARVRRVPFVGADAEMSLDLDAIQAGFRAGARVLVFSNPHNPTGAVMSAETLRRLAEIVVEADGWVVADELYSRFVYDTGAATHLCAIPPMRERCVTLLGPSKTESASGFRIGLLVAPPAVVDAVTKVIEITTVRAPSYAQYALERWMADDQEFITERVGAYRRLRDMTVARLAQVEGLETSAPAATAWLFPSIAGLGRGEREVVEALITAGILVMPGSLFGPAGAGHIRLCFGQDESSWPTVLDRMAETFDALRG